METMPHHRAALDEALRPQSLPVWGPLGQRDARDWRDRLPVLRGLGVTLRELVTSDAPALVEHLTPAEVSRFISPPPSSVQGFERFIAWAHREREAGRYACFAVVPDGATTAVGLFQIRLFVDRPGVAEWGFILGAAYWGSGLFLAGAQSLVDFAFDEMGLERLEARASVENGRGNGALEKLGAWPEALLRQSFERHGRWHDQRLWRLCRRDWHLLRAVADDRHAH